MQLLFSIEIHLRCMSSVTVLDLGGLLGLLDTWHVTLASWWDRSIGPILSSRILTFCWAESIDWSTSRISLALARIIPWCDCNIAVDSNRFPLTYQSTSGVGLPPNTWHWRMAHWYFFRGPNLDERNSRPVSSVIIGSDGGTENRNRKLENNNSFIYNIQPAVLTKNHASYPALLRCALSLSIKRWKPN